MIEFRWRRGDELDGLLLPLPAPPLVELAGHLGYDFVVLDAEHGPGDAAMLHHHIATAHSVETEALVRVHGSELSTIPRILDIGADGIVLPDVRNAQDAAAAVALTRFPPLGVRGFAMGSTAGRWGLADPDTHARNSPLVVAMIEHPDGVAAVGEISRVPGIDGVFVGRADLAMAMGLGPDPDHRRIGEALHATRQEAGTRHLAASADARPGDIRLHNAARLIASALTTARALARAPQEGTR